MHQTAPLASPGSRHLGQLDSLRALAVLGVLASHWLPGIPLPVGTWGVRLFFVLSGFLITGILLRARDDAAAVGAGRGRIVAAFYARRFLRIFPLYYATLALSALIQPANRPLMPWFLSYSQNLLFAAWGEPRQLAHTWSLAVEEQFYLVWPWLVLFASPRWLGRAVGGAVLLGPATKLVALAAFGASPYAAAVLPTSQWDTLGAGGLLALLFHRGRDRPNRLRRGCRLALLVGAASLGLLTLPLLASGGDPARLGAVAGAWMVLDDLASAVAFAGLIGLAACRIGGPAGRLLDLRPLREVGKVSYGVYILHPFAPNRVARLGLDPAWTAHPAVWLLATLAVAFASWHLFEAPINALKARFPYLQPSGRRGRSARPGERRVARRPPVAVRPGRGSPPVPVGSGGVGRAAHGIGLTRPRSLRTLKVMLPLGRWSTVGSVFDKLGANQDRPDC